MNSNFNFHLFEKRFIQLYQIENMSNGCIKTSFQNNNNTISIIIRFQLKFDTKDEEQKFVQKMETTKILHFNRFDYYYCHLKLIKTENDDYLYTFKGAAKRNSIFLIN